MRGLEKFEKIKEIFEKSRKGIKSVFALLWY